MAATASLADRRWIGISGLVFVGLLVVAFVVGTAPEADASDSKILDYFTDSGNQAKQIVSAVLVIVVLCSFLVFLTELRLLLVEGGAAAPFPELALVGGLVFATLTLAGLAVGTAIPATFVFSDQFELNPDTARVILTIGNIWLLSFAGAAGSLLVGAASLASRQTRLLPAWLEWAGLIAAPLMIVALPFFALPALLLFVWVLAVSIALLVRERRLNRAR